MAGQCDSVIPSLAPTMDAAAPQRWCDRMAHTEAQAREQLAETAGWAERTSP